MTAKPSDLPRWANTGGASIVEPSSGKKDVGHVSGEQPPAQHLNWLLNKLYQWTQYLNSPDSITLGEDVKDTEAHAVAARITVNPAANGTANYTLWASLGDGRVWVGSSTKLCVVLTYNATRTTDGSGKWAKITSSQVALALYLFRDKMVLGIMPSSQNTAWADAFVDTAGTTSGWGRMFDQSNNPASTAVVLANALHGKHISKAWGLVYDDGAAVSVIEGVNIASVSRNTITNTITVTFATPMADANFAAPAICDDLATGTVCFATVVSRSTTTVVYRFLDAAATLTLDIGSQPVKFSFNVFGQQ